MAERRRTCPYTIIAFSVNGYGSLTRFREFTPLQMRHIIKSTIETTAFQRRYRSMTTANTDLDRFNIQLSPLMAAEKSSETHWHTRRVTGNDVNYHEYRTRQFDPAYERNQIPQTYLCSNTIPMSQLSAIISQRTYNQTRDLTPESPIPQTKGEVVRRLRVSIVTTTLLLIERSAAISICVYTYTSSNLEEADWRKHSTATYTYAGGSTYERNTPTATNICTSEVHLQRNLPYD
jgi:hypothetical protein